MHFNQKDYEHLLLHYAGKVAADRKTRGVRLNYVESIAFISRQIMEDARDGESVSNLMQKGRSILSRTDVMEGVPEMIDSIQIEATFPDGPKLVTVHNPIQ